MTENGQPSLKSILEAVLLAANQPLTVEQLQALFPEAESPRRAVIRETLAELRGEYAIRAIELVEVASGYRFQVRHIFAPWLRQLYAQQPPRYSRALLETLAIIAYRQPITRTEIETIRGVSISSAIMKNLLEYQWIRVLAYRSSPGRPALYGTTRAFLDHFSLKTLDELPTLAALRDMEKLPLEEIDEDNPDNAI
ncbi:MAG: SMC-Scp complex subunit ScpB [Beggiatoa sp. IS2]|nr:MAG: SMC-Scp complex subunit ScpB [Beggiatoa sp. IS2]